MRSASLWVVVAVICTAEFMVVLDVSVVNVALPSIESSLGFSGVGLQWVVNAYAVVFGGFLLVGGRLADLYGHRRVFLGGLGMFTAASLAGGLAGTPGALVVARAVQGLGAAVLTPATLTIINTAFPEGWRRARALAVWVAIASVGGAAGNIIGGGITEYLSWRWILLINVPVGALVAVSAVLLVGRDGEKSGGTLDLPGAVLATAGVAAVVWAITHAGSAGWTNAFTVSTLVAGFGLVMSFVAVEARFARTPLIPLRLFRVRSISAGNVVMLLAGACFMPMWYFLTLYMQKVLHYSPLQTGFAFLPHTIVAVVVGVRLTPWLMRYFNNRTLILAGALVAAAGFLWQSTITPHSGYLTGILGPAILISGGLGLLNTPLTATVTSGVSPDEAGAASGIMNTSKQIGGAVGLAALVVISSSALQTPFSLADAYGQAFLCMAAVLVATAVVTLLLPG